MEHVLFSGCSFTFGSGFDLESQDPNLWVNLLHQNTQLKKYNLLNTGLGGRSNAGIFSDAVYNLVKFDCKYAFITWTSSPRYELDLGLELYDTHHSVIPNASARQHNLNDCIYTPEYLNNVRDRFVTLAHPHYEILNIVYYINSLVEIAKLKKTKLFFINGLCEWDQDYFIRLTNVLPSEYTPFTQRLINIDSRDDFEIFQIYDKIHNQYERFGGIQESMWLNLYTSMKSTKIDVNSDNLHPGPKSNQFYYTQFNKSFQSKIGN